MGRYILVERLRTGGMAEVWRGLAEGPGGFLRKAAIKVILPAYAEDEDFLRMFMDEAAIAARLTHANIAQIHDFDVADGIPYLAMEFVEGKDLRSVLAAAARAHRPIPWEVAAGIALEVAKGLYYVHSLREDSRPLSIVHRDISPQNLMVSYSGEVKIVDFGIARAAKRSAVTRVGEVKGKCAYMSPEQALGRMVDARSDQFSLGVVLWELLTGRRLFGGGTPAETLARLVTTVVPSPHEVEESLPPELSPVVNRALARDPGDRYPNMLVFYDTLSRFLFDRKRFPAPHRLAAWLKDLFPAEVEAFSQGEGDDGLQSLDETPLEVTELDTGEWKFLKEAPEDQATRPMRAHEIEETTTDRRAATELSSHADDDFVPWDDARPAARNTAEAHPALRRTQARTVGLNLGLAFAGAGLAVAAWAWILGLGPFGRAPLETTPVATQKDAADAKSNRGASLAEMDVVVAMPEVVQSDATDAGPKAEGDTTAGGSRGVDAPPTEEPEPVEAPPSDPQPSAHSPKPKEPTPEAEAKPEPELEPVEAPPSDPQPTAHSPQPREPTPATEAKPEADPATFGTVHVAARPYAQIRADGRFAGVAPKDLQLPAGPHEIELTYLDTRHTCHVTLTERGEARCEHSFTSPESPPPAP
ncbi:MAG: protein kinase [Pseudomonadota bacterium]